MAWYHQRFTSTQSFTAPADVIWVSGCAGGCGGGGGHPAPGGGGGGGAAGECTHFFPLAVTTGETLTAVIGSYGAGGSPGVAGVWGGYTGIQRSGVYILLLDRGGGGLPGGDPNGGTAGYAAATGGAATPGGSGAGSNVYTAYGKDIASAFYSVYGTTGRWSAASPGGALNFNGGRACRVTSYEIRVGGTGGSNGGGGGVGGHSQFGEGGMGGSNGAPGANATGYGSGGGGGSGNSAGGNGSPGMLDIFWCTSAEDGAAMTLTAAYDAAKTAASQVSVNAIPTTPLLAANYTAPDNAGIAEIKAKTDALPASPAAVGSAMTLTSAYDAAKTAASQVSVNAIPTTPLLAANYTAPDNASIAAIKETVDSIQVDAEGNVSADITRILGADISGDGSIGNPWGPE